MRAEATNPHWIGSLPAWDIVFPDETIHKDVTKNEIRTAIQGLVNAGKLHHYRQYIHAVCDADIQSYAEFHNATGSNLLAPPQACT